MRWILLLLLVGCAAPTIDEIPPWTPPATYQGLFVYDGVSSYTYEAAIADLEVTITTRVDSWDYSGIAAHRLRNEVVLANVTYPSTMYISRSSHACLAIEEDDCPASGLNGLNVRGLLLEDLGQEWVSVPAGEFDAHRMTADRMTYWVVPSVPVPVKYAGEGFVMVLKTWE